MKAENSLLAGEKMEDTIRRRQGSLAFLSSDFALQPSAVPCQRVSFLVFGISYAHPLPKISP
ncbi:MAG: hypothetical protein WCP60_09035, partial [bacterium]